MAARRSRRSSGLGTFEQEDPLAEFDSFRRRHARQNREIITENITRKGLIRSLQDQVATLQAELLSARRENAVLTRELATLRENSHALDAIVGAVPALMRLRSALTAPAPRPRASLHPAPRAAASGPPPLGALAEEDESTPRRHSRSTQSEDSPFVSPSPKRTPRRRRRRESGLFPPQFEATPEPETEEDAVEVAITPVKQIKGRAVDVQVESTTPKASPGRRKRSPRKSPRASTPMSSPLTPAPEEPERSSPPTPPSAPSLTSVPSSSAASAGVSASSTSTAATSITESAPALSPKAAAPTTPSPPPQMAPTDPPSLACSTSSLAETSASTVTESAPEDGRSRRARSSVSYKEPSLRTKMRKPDGVSSEEALGLRPRGSMLEGVRRKSALPRSTAKMDFRADKEEQAVPLAPAKVVNKSPKEEGGRKATSKRRSAATGAAAV